MSNENVHLFSKNLTQRRKDAEEYRIFPSSFASPRLCVIKFGLIVVFFLFLPAFLSAQNGEGRFSQRLTWTEDEYARRYEVLIEKEEEGGYRELFQEFTTELFIQVSLLPGKYRCRVITHDFLNRPGPVPEWKYIEVLAGLNPEQVSKTDDIELVHTTGDAESGRLVDNPDIFFSVAWMPSFTVSDRGNRFFRGDKSLGGVAGRFGVVWTKPHYFNPGLELAASYNSFDSGAEHLLAFTLNLSALKWLPGDRAALTFRLGAGYSVFLPNDGTAHANIGISFLLFVMEHWYLETGLDYAQSLPAPSSSCFRPWIGVGFYK
jgi:hypothetical protein